MEPACRGVGMVARWQTSPVDARTDVEPLGPPARDAPAADSGRRVERGRRAVVVAAPGQRHHHGRRHRADRRHDRLARRRRSVGDADGGDVDIGFLQDMRAHHEQAVQMGFMYLALEDTDPGLAHRRPQHRHRSEPSRSGGWSSCCATSGRPRPPRPTRRWPGWACPTTVDEMPGMASEAELDELAATSGADADELFVELMVAHHEGGLHMAEYAADDAEDARGARPRRIDRRQPSRRDRRAGAARRLMVRTIDAASGASEPRRVLLAGLVAVVLAACGTSPGVVTESARQATDRPAAGHHDGAVLDGSARDRRRLRPTRPCRRPDHDVRWPAASTGRATSCSTSATPSRPAPTTSSSAATLADLQQWWAEQYPELYGAPFEPLTGRRLRRLPRADDPIPGCGRRRADHLRGDQPVRAPSTARTATSSSTTTASDGILDLAERVRAVDPRRRLRPRVRPRRPGARRRARPRPADDHHRAAGRLLRRGVGGPGRARRGHRRHVHATPTCAPG